MTKKMTNLTDKLLYNISEVEKYYHYTPEVTVREFIIKYFVKMFLYIDPENKNQYSLEVTKKNKGRKKRKKDRADIVCTYPNHNEVVIEIKSINTKIDEIVEDQLHGYMMNYNERMIGFATNGKTYKLYRKLSNDEAKEQDIDAGLKLLCEIDDMSTIDHNQYTKAKVKIIQQMAEKQMNDEIIAWAENEFENIKNLEENNSNISNQKTFGSNNEYNTELLFSHIDKCEKKDDNYDAITDTDIDISHVDMCKKKDTKTYTIKHTPNSKKVRKVQLTIKKQHKNNNTSKQESPNNTVLNDNHNFIIKQYIPEKKYNSILLAGNLTGLLGYFYFDTENITHFRENDNFYFFKKSRMTTEYTFIGTVDTYQYILKTFRRIGISEKKINWIKINNITDWEEKIYNIKDMHFDVAIVNPPYQGMLYTKIISEILPYISEHYVGVHPLTYCMYSKRNQKTSVEIKNIMKSYETHIFIEKPQEYFPQNVTIGQIFGITHIDKTKSSALFLNNIKKNSFDEIQSYADGNPILQKIPELLKNLNEVDNVENHKFTNENAPAKEKLPNKNIAPNTLIIKLGRGTGRTGDFYCKDSKTIISHTDFNTISRFEDFKGDYYIETGSSKMEIAKRIKEYLKTDFARMTLFITKPTSELFKSNTALSMIPWFDFNDDMFNGTYKEINERLFNKYIPETIRKKLKNVLAKELTDIYEK